MEPNAYTSIKHIFLIKTLGRRVWGVGWDWAGVKKRESILQHYSTEWWIVKKTFREKRGKNNFFFLEKDVRPGS